MSGYFQCACCGMDEMSGEHETNLCGRCVACACDEDGGSPECRHCIIDGAAGIYVPQRFAEEFAAHWYGFTREDLEILKAGPEHEHYWEAWETVLDSAWFLKGTAENGSVWRLEQDGDLFAWCDCADTSDSPEFWRKEVNAAESARESGA